MLTKNLYHCLLTGHANTGILHLFNKTPIDWYMKQQAMVEMATYGSEFVAARQAVDQIIDLPQAYTTLDFLLRTRHTCLEITNPWSQVLRSRILASTNGTMPCPITMSEKPLQLKFCCSFTSMARPIPRISCRSIVVSKNSGRISSHFCSGKETR